MRGTLANHLQGFINDVNAALNKAREDGITPTPELARENLTKLSGFVTQIPQIAFAEERRIYHEQIEIPVRVYSPNPQKELPVLIYFHGGGHMCGSTELYDPMCRKLAIAGDCVVISVDYRLAPEFPYPAGVNDCEAVVKKYHQALVHVGYSNTVMIGGDSAGGAICGTLTMRKKDDPELNFSKQILIYPSLDYTMSQPSIQENGEGYLLERTRIQWYFDNYFDDYEDRKLCSPLFAELSEKMPDTLLIVAGCDPLRDEGLLYAQQLTDAGHRVVVREFAHMIHAFMNIEDLVPDECRELYKVIGDFINEDLPSTIAPPAA